MNTFCRYSEKNSIIHKIDPRIKFIFAIAFSVIVFLNYGNLYMNVLISLVQLALVSILAIISKSSILSIFKSLKALWFMILILVIVNILFSNDNSSYILFSIPIFNGINIRIGSLLNVTYVLLRLIIMLIIANILTTTTTPLDLSFAIEFLLTPLKLIKIPVYKFSLALSLAIRFVPVLSDQARNILKSQASRGLDFHHEKLILKIKSISSLIIPMFVLSLNQSSILSDALSARGYNPFSKRSRYSSIKFSFRDGVAIGISCLILALFIVLAILKINIFEKLGIIMPYL